MASDPNPRKNILKASPLSFMNFMPEQVVYDEETDSTIRFRAMFEMPSWDGVEESERTYLVEGPDERLDKIAAAAWGEERSEMYWIIAARNNLDLPDVQLYKGRKLKIPSRNWIDTKFLPQGNRYIER
ncbi:MAG: hypothetical protein PHI12_08965 [Dehalococcoidales bacterium]|nr:hypothetical protein [Dehalococcoidales bacterium]